MRLPKYPMTSLVHLCYLYIILCNALCFPPKICLLGLKFQNRLKLLYRTTGCSMTAMHSLYSHECQWLGVFGQSTTPGSLGPMQSCLYRLLSQRTILINPQATAIDQWNLANWNSSENLNNYGKLRIKYDELMSY